MRFFAQAPIQSTGISPAARICTLFAWRMSRYASRSPIFERQMRTRNASLAACIAGFDSSYGSPIQKHRCNCIGAFVLVTRTRNRTRQCKPQGLHCGFAFAARRSESGSRSETFSRRRACKFSPQARFPYFVLVLAQKISPGESGRRLASRVRIRRSEIGELAHQA